MKKYLGKRFQNYLAAYDYAITHIKEAAVAFAMREASQEAVPRIAARIRSHYSYGVDDLFGFDADKPLPEGYTEVDEALTDWYDAQRRLADAVERYLGEVL